jgi:DNA-binding transcriptional regulator YiaG
MATLATALRSEIRRGTAAEIQKLVRAVSGLKTEIRGLRREQRRAARASASSRGRLVAPVRGRRSAKDKGPDIPPREVLAFRKGLGLSRHDFGKLVGISHGTVYLWEVGRVAPRGFNREKYVRAKKRYGKKAGLLVRRIRKG